MLEGIQRLLNHGWMGSLISLSSILIAIVVYLRSRHHPGIAYEIQSISLLRAVGNRSDMAPKAKSISIYRGGPEGVEVFCHGLKVDQLVRSTIILWNTGNQTFRMADLVDSDPLRIEIASGRILASRITSTTRAVNGFSVLVHDSNPPSSTISFDYIDPRDGATFELIHTSEASPALLGTIRGLPRGPRAIEISSNEDPLGAITMALSQRALLLFVLGAAVAALAGGAVVAYMADWVGAVALTVMGFVLLLGGWTLHRRCPSILVTDQIL
jgi:hypothetical protein